MAERRMFAKKITDADAFTAMPPTAQCLYFHLCMSADDDGFSNSIRQSLFNAHASTDDFDTLVKKRFIIPFESGVIVIKHWKIHNYIQNDRYKGTSFIEEKARLVLKENNAYTEVDTQCIQDVSTLYPQDRIGKDSIGKNSIGKDSIGNNMVISDDRQSPFEAEFDELWQMYPRKQGKQNALKAYIKARKEGVRMDDIINGLDKYNTYIKQEKIEARFIKQGSTWFNQRSWEDDYSTMHKATFFDELENIKQTDEPFNGNIWESA